MKTLSVGLVSLLALTFLIPSDTLGNLRHPEDATLHDVQFFDANEGWAVGDEGVVLHTIDGGETWERQATATRASLRSVHFITPFEGWVVGREERPLGENSVGVVLYTRNGGSTWKRVFPNTFPGLNRIRFVTPKTGFLIGDGSDIFATGIFKTTNGGRNWQPVPGSRSPSWLDGDFLDEENGALGGCWNRLASFASKKFTAAEVDALGGRNVRALRLQDGQGIAVGEGGLILVSRTAGTRWGFADTKLPKQVLANLDFHAVERVGNHVWVIGRPGSVLLHSNDKGLSWERWNTDHPLPINGIHFLDERKGWAVGTLGSILNTRDGGRTWQLQRAGGKRAALLFLHSQGKGLPVETLSQLGLAEGFLVTGIQITAPDHKTESLQKALTRQRFAMAVRKAGGVNGEMLWQFPLPQHLFASKKADLLRYWNQLHEQQGNKELLRQLVLAIRMWRPEVIVTDNNTGSPLEAFITEAIQQAYAMAAEEKAFPEQLEKLGLKTWKAAKVYCFWDTKETAHVNYTGTKVFTRLKSTPIDYAQTAADLLSGKSAAIPYQRSFRLLHSRIPNAENHRHLMSGLELKTEKDARRKLPAEEEPDQAIVKAIRARRNLQNLIDNPANELASPEKVLANIKPVLSKLPLGQRAPAAFALANQYARMGQWVLARETFLLMVDNFPTHPLTAEAYGWLIRHNTSSEAQRRYELGQFILVNHAEVVAPEFPTHQQLKQLWIEREKERQKQDGKKQKSRGKNGKPARLPTELDKSKILGLVKDSKAIRSNQLTYLRNRREIRKWYQGSLEYGKRLERFGPIYSFAPGIQFCLKSANRHLGDFKKSVDWFKTMKEGKIHGPWRSAAAAEYWLSYKVGPCPKPLIQCFPAPTRPLLDGKFDDPCWRGINPVVLQKGNAQSGKHYQTLVRMTFDRDFLYLALSCSHPPGRQVEPKKHRKRDEDLRGHDRVSILLDLDRDYATYFHFQVDQRGCVNEDCWGDRTWNPQWFVAVQSNETSWNIEAAIPLKNLTGNQISLGQAWTCNFVRIIPGQGIQAFSTPANVSTDPKGMGILLFGNFARQQIQPVSGTRQKSP